MELVIRLAVALFVTTAPTLLFLGLMRGLKAIRDDATLARLATREDLPPEVTRSIPTEVTKRASSESTTGDAEPSSTGASKGVTDAAADLLRTGPIRSDRSPDDPDRISCPACGASNMAGTSYCGACLKSLNET